MKKEFISIESLDKPVTVIKQDLANQYGVEATAFKVMDVLQEKVSPELWDLLYQMLLPFADSMQLEIADDLLDFAHGHVIHTTGCPSADYVLDMCYAYIADEHGILDEEAIQNMLEQYRY